MPYRENKEARQKGKQAELEFVEIAENHGMTAKRLQAGRGTAAVVELPTGCTPTAPDVIIYPNLHTSWHYHGHEIKWKYPTRYGCFGLEDYRLKALLAIEHAFGNVQNYYTICNSRTHRWATLPVQCLTKRIKLSAYGKSYCNGELIDNVLIHYWDVKIFRPLDNYFEWLRTTAPKGRCMGRESHNIPEVCGSKHALDSLP